jgi:hypothetical protein
MEGNAVIRCEFGYVGKHLVMYGQLTDLNWLSNRAIADFSR